MHRGVFLKILGSKRQVFTIFSGASQLRQLTKNDLPKQDEVFKFISFIGGFSSVSFIKLIADTEPILELTASTLRIGETQFRYLAKLARDNLLLKATFFVGTVMQCDASAGSDYLARFKKVCIDNNWDSLVTNNHSKIILMRTALGFYVLETSSNLNDNPKIEQYSFENNQELYNFYYEFFQALKAHSVKPKT